MSGLPPLGWAIRRWSTWRARPEEVSRPCLSQFLGSLSDAVVLEVGGDEAETLLSYGIIDQLKPGTVTEPGADPMAVGAQLLDLLDRLQADGQVVVLAIDDLQWADRPSSRAVLFALRRLRADKVLAIVSTRVGGLADPGWARFVSGDSRVTRIRLGGLSPGDLTELASALGLGVLSQRGASRLAAHTEGNALYCRALLDEIGIAGLSAAGDLGLPAPRELSVVILARVASLPASTQSFLAAASVLGQHAPMSVITSVARLPGAQNEVDAAVAAGLLTESASLLGPDLYPSVVSGGDLRRSQSGEPAGTARAGCRPRRRSRAIGPPGGGVPGS